MLIMIHTCLRRARLAFMAPLLLLAACTTLASLPPGTPLAQVESQFGRHNYSCPLPNEEQRVIWSRQPFGQFAWGTQVDAQGRVGEITSLLTDQNFQKLAQGTWTPERVLCEFGPPAEKSGVGLPGSVQLVWSYRYQQSGVWNSLMHVYFGQDGEKVTRFHPGPDPMYDRDRFMPFF